jgi:hypothetical protein
MGFFGRDSSDLGEMNGNWSETEGSVYLNKRKTLEARAP